MTLFHSLRRLATAFAVLVLCVSLAACVESTSGSGGSSSSGSQTLAERVSSGLSIRAERGSKTLDIQRTELGGKKPSSIAKDSWTVFVYLCGSDLETKGGAATKDLNEMISGRSGSNVRFVVETGGAKTWRNNTVDSRMLGRYLVQNGKIQDVGSVKGADMGKASTLSDFLTWGIKNYPADHMGLIMWDHGGGSITGVCFDERNASNSLYLREVDEALAATSKLMWDKFEFIGFDACLMSTLESANVLASYADYMIASQESEPGTGWEYVSIAQYLTKNPSATGAQIGKSMCDNYLASLDRNTRGFATLSVTDLSKVDQLMQDYYRFCQEMYASGDDQGTLAAMSRGIQSADNYGCNNWREGYTNMVDLGGLVEACSAVTPSAQDVQTTLHDAVIYQVRGTYHAGATGLSTYYPLKVNNSTELSVFQTVAVNPSYLSYVDRLAHGATYNGGTQYQQYDNGSLWQDDMWSWLFGNGEELQEETADHWNYVDDHSSTSATSAPITFAHKPQVDENGTYWFQLDASGLNNAESVSGMVYEVSDDGKDLIALGETCDVYYNWETGEFSDAFGGSWLSLPDGQNLNLAVEQVTDDYIVFTSPITLNGSACYLRMRQSVKDGSVTVEGAWNGVTSNGSVDRGLTAIKKGDVIVPQYKATTADGSNVVSDYEGDKFKVKTKTLNISYDALVPGTYTYCFNITDVYGDSFHTDSARFVVEADGTIYYE